MKVKSGAKHWIESFEFERLNRSMFTFEILDWDDPRPSVDRMAEAIMDEFRVRKARSKGRAGLLAPLKWLRVVCYHAIMTCLHYELFEFLEARVDRYERLVRGPNCDRSVFMVGIVGILAQDKPIRQSKTKLSKPLADEKDRMRLAEQMWWAFRHYVQPTEILGFNRKFALHRKAPKPAEDYLLPELHNQIIARRDSKEDESWQVAEARGVYPDEIEKAISAREDVPGDRPQSRYRDSSADLDEDWGGVELAAAHGFDDEDWE